MKDSFKYIWGYTLLNALFALVLVNIKDNNFFPSVFTNPILNYFGKVSYGLYVYHFPVMWILGKLMHNMFPCITVVTALIVTAIISTLSYELFEKRFIVLKDVYFKK